MIGGCTPAWRPDGSMTYVRRGAIVAFPRSGRAQVLRTEDEVSRLIERGSGAHGRIAIRAIAWLAPSRLGFVASVGRRALLGVIAGTNLAVARGAIPRNATELRASPRGTFLAVRTRAGIRVYRARSAHIAAMQTPLRADAVAWSPDERWTAFAAAGHVVLTDGRVRIVLPIVARDLAWTKALG
jgi:sugar lactone lactonase YvrE